jgi:hypothetical protein
MFVAGVIVDDGMDQLAGRDRAVDGIEKTDELLVAMPLSRVPSKSAGNSTSSSARIAVALKVDEWDG